MDIKSQEVAKRKSLEVFCCYARKDQLLLLELKTHLVPLEREGLITLWADVDINAGAEWEKEIHHHLNTSHIILLLVSPDFMASDYCYSVEMRRALERHARGEACVIPIILRPVNWQNAPFAKLQALPQNGRPIISSEWDYPDEGFADTAKGIRKAVETYIAKGIWKVVKGLATDQPEPISSPFPPAATAISPIGLPRPLSTHPEQQSPNPEVHSPDQAGGDGAKVVLFPNAAHKVPPPPPAHIPIIAVMGAKGGVGKGLFVKCSAHLIADAGHDVAIIDLDLSNRGTTLEAEGDIPDLPHVKTVFDHFAPHSVGFKNHARADLEQLWDITPPYLRERNRGTIWLLPAASDPSDQASAFDVIANIPTTSQHPREEHLLRITQEMLARIQREYPTVRCILIDCGAELNPIYLTAFGCADYRYILMLPDATYFPNTRLIRQTHRKRYPDRPEVFVVVNRVISEADRERCEEFHPKGFIERDPQMEEDIFRGGPVDYDLGYNNVFLGVRDALPKGLNQPGVELIPALYKVRLMPWWSRFVREKLAEQTLKLFAFRRRGWLSGGLSLAAIGVFLWAAANDLWQFFSVVSPAQDRLGACPTQTQSELEACRTQAQQQLAMGHAQQQLDGIILLLCIAILFGSLLWLRKHLRRRRLLQRIAALGSEPDSEPPQVLTELLDKADKPSLRWLKSLLDKAQEATARRRRRSLSPPAGSHAAPLDSQQERPGTRPNKVRDSNLHTHR